MMTQGIWILAWLCLNPVYCTKPTIAPLDAFSHPDVCKLVASELEKRVPEEQFICIQQGKA